MANSHAQELAITITKSETFRDKYKFSRIIAIDDDKKGGVVIVRAFYGGMVIKQKGYFIEHYNNALDLVSEYEYKTEDKQVFNVVVANGEVKFLEIFYNQKKKSYQYIANIAKLDVYKFKEKQLVSIGAKEVKNPIAKSLFDRDFGSSFTSVVLFNTDKTAFAIDVKYKKERKEFHRLVVFNNALEKWVDNTTDEVTTQKNYALESMLLSKKDSAVFLVGKSYFKKKRFSTTDRRFLYEMLKVSSDKIQSQEFESAGKYLEALKPVYVKNKLVCVGFYSDNRGEKRFNGLSYFNVAEEDLKIKSRKHNPFSAQFMLDKYGREESEVVKNLVFKGIHVTEDAAVVFNAEEYFVNKHYQTTGSGSGNWVFRHHYNDIVSAKLASNGTMEWARNINKTEVTQGDEAYASYTSYAKDGDTFFFINSGEFPQKISKERIMFKQGHSKVPNLFAIKISKSGAMSFGKIVDDKEIRLPIMVSKALVLKEANELLFLARRGSKKVLLKAAM